MFRHRTNPNFQEIFSPRTRRVMQLGVFRPSAHHLTKNQVGQQETVARALDTLRRTLDRACARGGTWTLTVADATGAVPDVHLSLGLAADPTSAAAGSGQETLEFPRTGAGTGGTL